MKTGIFLNEMLTLQECVSYGNQVTTVHSGFKYYEFNCSAIIEESCANKNIILFFLKGNFTVSCNQYTDRRFLENEMILIPKSSVLKISGQDGSQLLFMMFDMPEECHDRHEMQLLADVKLVLNYSFLPSSIRYPLTSFIEMVTYCLQNGMNHNAHLHCLMHREFFLLLKGFYTKEEMIAFLHPIIGQDPDFRDFIMQNYLKVNNVEELILLSNMGRSRFYTKFKEAFGITAKKWMQKQISERILGKVVEPGICVKQLMETCGIESHTHFYRYFKQHFGCTPKELINRYQSKQE